MGPGLRRGDGLEVWWTISAIAYWNFKANRSRLAALRDGWGHKTSPRLYIAYDKMIYCNISWHSEHVATGWHFEEADNNSSCRIW
jgi:hypothetical protein